MKVIFLFLFLSVGLAHPVVDSQQAKSELALRLAFGSHLYALITLITLSDHGKTFQSFYKEKPKGAFYELELTLETPALVKKESSSPQTLPLKETKIFQNETASLLVEEVNDFTKKWIQKNKTEQGNVTISLKSSLITARGKTITLTPYSRVWDEREGIECDLRKIFMLSPRSLLTLEELPTHLMVGTAATLLFYLTLVCM
jgi:hypothetical protein